jgi:putative transposase
MQEHEIFLKGRQHRKVKARSLLCLWAVTELGVSLRELATRLEMSGPAVGLAVGRGQTIARNNGYELIA